MRTSIQGLETNSPGLPPQRSGNECPQTPERLQENVSFKQLAVDATGEVTLELRVLVETFPSPVPQF